MRFTAWVACHLLTGVALAGGDPPPQTKIVTLKSCEISYDRVTTIGAFVLVQAGGRVQDCYVRPGDRVKAGQVLGRLHDRDAIIELKRLRQDAANDVDLRLGQAKLELASAKLKRCESLYQRSLLSSQDFEVVQLEAKSARLEIDQAAHRLRQSNLLAERMDAEVRSREFICPHDGTVVEILKNVNESCICNEPIMRIVHDDQLWVTGYLDVGDSWKVRRGQFVRVFPEIEGAEVAIEGEVFVGRVLFVDPQIDPKNGTCKVVADVQNRDRLLRSGLMGRMEIDLDSGLGFDQPKRAVASEPNSPTVAPNVSSNGARPSAP